MYPLEAETKAISMRQPYAVDHATVTPKQLYAFTGCRINKTFILALFIDIKYMNSQCFLYLSFIFVFNSRIDLLYLTD